MTDSATDRLRMQDPRHQYPRPPFPEQPQTAPGLSADMNPVPDQGETTYKGNNRLPGRKALVTGADSGIGAATALAFAREGADVAMSYLPQEESDARAIAALIEKAGRKALLLPGDITDRAFCESLIAKTAAAFGGLDILVNNAGKQTNQDSIDDVSFEQFDRTLKTNLYAMFWICKAAVKLMPPGGAIINTASVVAYKAPEILLDYSTTKAGIIAFTKVLAKQMIAQGIRVNAVAPGPFWTPLQPSGGQPQEEVMKFGSETPIGRPGQPVEIAPIYVFLASQEASYVTGETYGATGGTGLA